MKNNNKARNILIVFDKLVQKSNNTRMLFKERKKLKFRYVLIKSSYYLRDLQDSIRSCGCDTKLYKLCETYNNHLLPCKKIS